MGWTGPDCRLFDRFQPIGWLKRGYRVSNSSEGSGLQARPTGAACVPTQDHGETAGRPPGQEPFAKRSSVTLVKRIPRETHANKTTDSSKGAFLTDTAQIIIIIICFVTTTTNEKPNTPQRTALECFLSYFRPCVNKTVFHRREAWDGSACSPEETRF